MTLLSDGVVAKLLSVHTAGSSVIHYHALLRLTKATRDLVRFTEYLPGMRMSLVACSAQVLADPRLSRAVRFAFLPPMGACFEVLDMATPDHAALPELGVNAPLLGGLGTWRQFATKEGVPQMHVEEIKLLYFEKLFFAADNPKPADASGEARSKAHQIDTICRYAHKLNVNVTGRTTLPQLLSHPQLSHLILHLCPHIESASVARKRLLHALSWGRSDLNMPISLDQPVTERLMYWLRVLRADGTYSKRPAKSLETLVAAQERLAAPTADDGTARRHTAEEERHLLTHLRDEYALVDQLTIWADSGNGYSPPPLLVEAGCEATAVDWHTHGPHDCFVAILDGKGARGMGQQTLDALETEFGATVLEVTTQDRPMHLATYHHRTGEEEVEMVTDQYRILHIATDRWALKVYHEASAPGEVSGVRAGTHASRMMAQGINEIYVMAADDLNGHDQGARGGTLPYAQSSLCVLSGGQASAAVRAVYAAGTGFASPQAYYASLRNDRSPVLGFSRLRYRVSWTGGIDPWRELGC